MDDFNYFRVNSFDQEHIDWKNVAVWLMWRNVVYHKNEYSGYDIVVEPIKEYVTGYKRGDIINDTRYLSYSIGQTRQLTWKELALALGLFKNHLTWDGHDCKVCEKRKGCKAYFKDDPDQERCNLWWEKHGYPDDEAEYKKFMDKLMESRPIKLLTKEEYEEFLKLGEQLNKDK